MPSLAGLWSFWATVKRHTRVSVHDCNCLRRPPTNTLQDATNLNRAPQSPPGTQGLDQFHHPTSRFGRWRHSRPIAIMAHHLQQSVPEPRWKHMSRPP